MKDFINTILSELALYRIVRIAERQEKHHQKMKREVLGE